MTRTILLLLLATGCGSSVPTPDDALDEEEQREQEALRRANEAGDRLRAEEPEAPYETMSRRTFRVEGARCGQGPYRVSFDALAVRYGERLHVYACAPREVAGRFRLQRSDRTDRADSRSFGYSQENDRCVASEVERARGPSSGGGSREVGAGAPGEGPTGGAPEEETAEAVELSEVAAVEECPEGLRRIGLVHGDSWWGTAGSPGISAGTTFALELWSALPNDMADVLLVIEQEGVRADVTVAQWEDYVRAHERWLDRYRAYLEGEVDAGRAEYVEDEGGPGPPPAPRQEEPPPRPSVHAEWVPGYWHFEGRWSWITGLWRVPESDLRAELTVRAPTPPPAARAEAPSPAKPARTAVWTPGYWQWNGRSYVWVSGAWRLPPTTRHQWQPASWRAGARGSIFVPGGWTLSVGGP